MPLSKEEFQETMSLICPLCRKGLVAVQRPDTKEWVHGVTTGGVQTHSICWANGLRNSRFAENG